MVPAFVLTIVFLLGLAVSALGWHVIPDWRTALAIALAAMFMLTASAHWGRLRSDLVRMVPPRFSDPEQMVSITGFLELTGSVGLLIPFTRKDAAIGLALLLVAMFPANTHAANTNLTLAGKPVTPLRWRVPLQALYVLCLLVVIW